MEENDLGNIIEAVLFTACCMNPPAREPSGQMASKCLQLTKI
jgi:hypothetical protein